MNGIGSNSIAACSVTFPAQRYSVGRSVMLTRSLAQCWLSSHLQVRALKLRRGDDPHGRDINGIMIANAHSVAPATQRSAAARVGT
jgi:hypothetical protein